MPRVNPRNVQQGTGGAGATPAPSTPPPSQPPTPPQKPAHSHQQQIQQQQNRQQNTPTVALQPPVNSVIPQAAAAPNQVAQYGNTQRIVHDPKPSPRGVIVNRTGQQYTAQDKSFSLREGEYGTLQQTGTVPIQQEHPMSMGSPSAYVPAKHMKNKQTVNVPTPVTTVPPSTPKKRTYPTLDDTKSFVGTFEHPFVNPKQDKKEQGKLTYDIEVVGATEKPIWWTGIDDRFESPTYGKEITIRWTEMRGGNLVFNFYHEKTKGVPQTQGIWNRKGVEMRADPVHHPAVIEAKQDRAFEKDSQQWNRDFFGGEQKKRSKFKIFEHWYMGKAGHTDTDWGETTGQTPRSNVKSSIVSSKKWQQQQTDLWGEPF